ncbi:MAG: TonB-dependent receptor [Acidobacteriota bacterium]|nr:TonB-dependent receptor [Acidobacteriota bacterium]
MVLPDVISGPVGARAQDLDNVTISGRVADTNGAALPRADVLVVLTSTGAERRVTADEEGLYRVAGLGPGVYVARASFAGFAVGERGNLVTVAGQHVRLDFTLQPAGVTAEQVVVSEAGAPPVDTTRTVVGGTVTRDEIESLPLPSRSPLDFVFTLSGVTEEPLSTRDAAEDRDPNARSATAERNATTPEEAGAFALSGGAAYSNNITIDGLDNNDDRAARERFQPSLEAIEEVQVILNQFSAEYGRASGGRINLRTRGGSNDVRGRLLYFFRDESLNANTFNNNRRGLARLPLQQHNPGFTLSGPLDFGAKHFGTRRDAGRGRTFFFGAYEHDAVLDSALIDALVPVGSNPLFPLPAPTTLAGRRVEPTATAPHLPAELAPFVERISTPLSNHILTARVDHKFNDAHNAAFLYQLGRQKNLRQFGGGLRLAESLQGRTRDADALSYSDTYVFSPRVINQLRAQWSRLAPSVSASNRADSSPVVLMTINDPLDALDPDDRSGTLVAGSSSSGASERRETRWQIQNSLNVIAGAHSVKMGGDAQRIRSSFVDLVDAGGTYNFTSAGDFLANAPSRFRQRFGTASIQRNTYLGLFAQDEWRLAPNLTISFGIRYEHETIIRDRNNFAPRVALAYDPLGTGRTVIRAGAGVFYNRAMLETCNAFTSSDSLTGMLTS